MYKHKLGFIPAEKKRTQKRIILPPFERNSTLHFLRTYLEAMSLLSSLSVNEPLAANAKTKISFDLYHLSVIIKS